MVYPACAGIHPEAIRAVEDRGCLPRMRGDPPVPFFIFSVLEGSTPHARGSTCVA